LTDFVHTATYANSDQLINVSRSYNQKNFGLILMNT